MITDQERAKNFVESVYVGLDELLKEGPRKFGFQTGPNHPNTERMVELVVEGFADKGITAVVKSNRRVKTYPSTSLTLEFSK